MDKINHTLGENVTIDDYQILRDERKQLRLNALVKNLEEKKKKYAKVINYVETYEENKLNDPYELSAAKKLLKSEGLL